MRAIDRCAIEEFKIPSLVLMENAGRGIAEAVLDRFSDPAGQKVVVVAGKGNNGGDGFVAARYLFNRRMDVQIFLCGLLSDLKGDAAVNAQIVGTMTIPVREIQENNVNSIDHSLRHAEIIIDALFGTGLTQAVAGLYEKVIDKINALGKFIVAADIASGVDSDSGQLIGPHVQAHLTLALALMKRSHLLFPAAAALGEVRVVDIGIPEKAVESQSVAVQMTEEEDLRGWFPERPRDTHKGDYGHVLVIAGSRGKGGAAGLAALAALRAGCGLVTLALPEGCQKACEFHPLEVMTVAVPETGSGAFALAAHDLLLEQCRGKSVVALGPGISTDPETVRLIQELLPEIRCPLVIDADALNCLAQVEGLLAKIASETVLTPHAKEMSRICGLEIAEILDNRIEAASGYAEKNSTCLVLKGARTLIAFADGKVTLNPTGNPGMATAGTGDVLTGIIAGLIAQGLGIREAAVAGTYLHGLAGDICAEESGETSLIAGDLLQKLPRCLNKILS